MLLLGGPPGQRPSGRSLISSCESLGQPFFGGRSALQPDARRHGPCQKSPAREVQKSLGEKTESEKCWLRYTLVRYEDLAERTEEMVKSLYARLGLRWTEKIRWRRNKHGPPITLNIGVQWGPTLRQTLGRTWWIMEPTGNSAFELNGLTGWDLYGLRP